MRLKLQKVITRRKNMEKSELETVKHRLKLLWYHGESATYYGCWSSSDADLKALYQWVLDNKYRYLDNITTRGLV